MRKALAALSVLAALVLPAAAAETANKVKFNPREIVRLQMLPGRPAQGIWQFGNGQYLVTQDVDGRAEHEWVRFNLFDEGGGLIRKWELNYGTHGQSLFVDKHKGGYRIYTESANRKGFAVFDMNEDRTALQFSHRVTPRDGNGKTIEFHAFGVDEARDTIIVADSGSRKTVQYFVFSDFVDGKLTPASNEIHIKKPGKNQGLGWLQGVGTENGIGYVLTGNSELDSKKFISRVGKDGNLTQVEIEPDRDRANYHYEPEGLYVQNGRLLFTMYDYYATRVYEVKAK
jgi:hypothetical protein